MTTWETAIAFVLKEEGGYTVDPNDHGGETNFGISKRRYPNLDIKNLTREAAVALYQKDFWNVCRCDDLPAPLAIAVFDAAVNQGEGGAGKMLQTLLGVKVDGKIGDETVAAVKKADGAIVRRFLTKRMARYIRTVLKDPAQEVFIDNWSSRLMRCAELTFKTEA